MFLRARFLQAPPGAFGFTQQCSDLEELPMEVVTLFVVLIDSGLCLLTAFPTLFSSSPGLDDSDLKS